MASIASFRTILLAVMAAGAVAACGDSAEPGGPDAAGDRGNVVAASDAAGGASSDGSAPETGGSGSLPDGSEGGSDSSGGAADSGDERGTSPGSDAGLDGGAPESGAAGEGGSIDGVTIVPDPSWACGMADGGIPPPESGSLVFRASLQLGATQDVGTTQYGHRRVLDVKGGSLQGSRVTATVLTGGWDFELTLSNGAVELEEIDMLRASDGTLIYLRSCGVAPARASSVRIVPDFEVATSSSLAWLNTGKFAGTRVLDSAAGTIEVDVYDISSVAAADPRLHVAVPTGVPSQPWDCATASGTKGATVFTESVTLGASLSVGASKRGTRNVIPITGGTTSGRLVGTIVPGGGDYQLIGTTTHLDARYVLASSDGEFVVVRNCGPLGALVPQFETRAAGPYAFLNASGFLSSDPGSASGGVSITFYQSQ
jgi:hypothetical protein